MHLSEFHFNRLFRRWAGFTPRQYLAFVTARAARGALARHPRCWMRAWPWACRDRARLHDLMVTLEAVTPGELKARGAGLTLRYGFSDTPFGRALLARTPARRVLVTFVEPHAEPRAAALAGRWPQARLPRDDAPPRARSSDLAKEPRAAGTHRCGLRCREPTSS